MKFLCPKKIFQSPSSRGTLLSNSRIPQISLLHFAQFSTLPTTQFHSQPSSSSHHHSWRQEEESRLVRVSVWWDFENCTVPAGAHVFRITQSITAAVRANGIKGPVQITAFGDVMQMSRSNQEALSSTGINLTHIPHGGKNSADRSLLIDLMYWVSQNPPPAHLFLISGDRDFANILHRLRLNNYNILLSSPDNAPGVLLSAASIMWQWSALVRGENLHGKRFNQPPDGPFGSWYGHYRLPLDDPFAVNEQPANSRAEVSSESGSESKLRPVPKAVVKQIRYILSSYPEGISITDLRAELGKTNVSLDRDLYGYKRFSRFLSSMSHILNIQSDGDGQFSIHSIAANFSEPAEDTPVVTLGPVSNNVAPEQAISGKRYSGDSSCSSLEEKKSITSSPKVRVGEPLRKLQELPKQVEEPLKKVPDTARHVVKASNIEVTKEPLRKLQELPNPAEESLKKVTDPLTHVENANNAEVPKEQDPIQEVGFFKSIWRKWIGGANDSGSDENNSPKPDSSICSTDKKIVETKKNCDSAHQCTDSVIPPSNSSPTSETIMDKDLAMNRVDRSSRESRYFSKIFGWCKFWRSHKLDYSNELSRDKMTVIQGDSKERGIFSKESFWKDMVVFIYTPKGSDVVVRSKTRKELAQRLGKEGPSVLRNLNESDLLQLVDLLISDKKWVQEYPSQKFPFQLIRLAKKGSSSNPPASNGLRYLFLNVREKGNQNHPNNGTSLSPQTIHKDPCKSKRQTLADCQKLVNNVVKEYPEGFHMDHFRKLFLERYGYSLDVDNLGYQKLESMLQLMHGVKIESNYIVPELPSGKDLKSDDCDSQWEELGPISDTNPEKNEMERANTKVKEEIIGKVNNDYVSLSDDDLSDSDEDRFFSSIGSEGQAKPGAKGEDSSLLQILDSCHSDHKEYDSKKVGPRYNKVGGMGDSSRKGVVASSYARGVSNQNEVITERYGPKRRSSKNNYSFVSDQVVDDKEKLIDGILGSLKKSGERSAATRIQI